MSLSKGSFSGLNQIIDSDDFISGDKFLGFTKTEIRSDYFKTDFLYKPGVWRGKEVLSLLENIKELKDQVLVFGHSDQRVRKTEVNFLHFFTGAKKIYGTNLRSVPGKSEIIPIGLTNNSGESELHDIFGNTKHIIQANSLTDGLNKEFNFSVYVNFTIQNNIRVREMVSRLINQLPKTYSLIVEAPSMTEEGRINYLANLRRLNFVLCPEGNGMDTHRLWETLYMGGVPVVVKSKYLDSLYLKLPLVRLDSWNDLLNPSILEAKWFEVQQLQWDDSILRQTYWQNRISRDLENA
jgi:hypothetical protein